MIIFEWERGRREWREKGYCLYYKGQGFKMLKHLGIFFLAQRKIFSQLFLNMSSQSVFCFSSFDRDVVMVVEIHSVTMNNSYSFLRVQDDKWKLALSPSVRETMRSERTRAKWGVHAL